MPAEQVRKKREDQIDGAILQDSDIDLQDSDQQQAIFGQENLGDCDHSWQDGYDESPIFLD